MCISMFEFENAALHYVCSSLSLEYRDSLRTGGKKFGERSVNPALRFERESERESASEASVHSLITRPLSAHPARPRLHLYSASSL